MRNPQRDRIICMWREDLALAAFIVGVTVKSTVVVLLIVWVLTAVQKTF